MILIPAIGETAQATAELGETQLFEFPAATGVANVPVMLAVTTGLPEVFLYVLQSAGLVGCTFTPLVSFNQDAGPTSEWLPLTAPQVLPVGIPIYFRDRIPGATAVGINLITPAGAVTSSFQVAIGAGG